MIEFFVPGIPAPQGSKRHVGHGRMIESSKRLPEWRSRVALFARAANSRSNGGPFFPLWTRIPVRVELCFTFPRPKGHYGTGRNAGKLKDSAPVHHVIKPDIDKLERAVLDALTGAKLWVDDSQVVAVSKRKCYGAEPGVAIRVTDVPLEEVW